MFAVSGSAAIASASSIFKNPVPSHGAKRNTVSVLHDRLVLVYLVSYLA